MSRPIPSVRAPLLRAALCALLPLAAAAASGCASARTDAAPPPALPDGAALDLADLGSFEAAVDAARVVLVGEYHDQRPHHEVQRTVLARMAARPGPVLLGFEMFHRGTQRHLDDYVSGRIDEREMLRRTGWYSRGGSGHTHYAPLWRLCRERGLRVVGLNADRAVTGRVSREGIGALGPEERAQIAADVDLTDAEHRARILAMFEGGAHPLPPESLQRMYEAMTIWDDTMAETAAHALADAGPGSRMLIVAGNGHVQSFDGVPDRLARRVPGLDPLVVVCGVAGGDLSGEPFPWEVADFVVRTPPDRLGDAPKLGVQFVGETLVLEKVLPGGNAERLGLRAGDELTGAAAQDGALVALRDLTDLRWVLEEFWERGGKGGLVTWRRDGVLTAKTLDLEPPHLPAAHP